MATDKKSHGLRKKAAGSAGKLPHKLSSPKSGRNMLVFRIFKGGRIDRFWQLLLSNRLLPFLLTLLFLSGSGAILWFYLPNQYENAANSHNAKYIADEKNFAENLDNHIGNYLLMEYWERQNDYQQTGRFYGAVSNWLGEDSQFRGRAFLGYLRTGDYARASAFFGTLENVTSDDVSQYSTEDLQLLSKFYDFGIEPYADWENLFRALQMVGENNAKQADLHLAKIETKTVVFDYAVPIIRFFLSSNPSAADNSDFDAEQVFANDRLLYVSLQLSQSVMNRDWEKIITITGQLAENPNHLPYDAKIFHLHALYHLGRKQEALNLIDSFSVPRSKNSFFFENIKSTILEDNLVALPSTAEKYIAEHFLGVAEFLSRTPAYLDDGVVLARLGLYLAPHHAGLQSIIADILTRQKAIMAAIHIREGMREFYEDSDFPLNMKLNNELSLARLYSDSDRKNDSDNKHPRGIELLREMQKQYPEFYQFYRHEGDIWRILGNYKAALKAYHKAFRFLPMGERDKLQPGFSQLEDVLANGEEAIFFQTPEIQQWREFAQLFYARGVAYERLGNWEKAEKDLLFAAAFYPQNAGILNYLAYSWADQGINLDQAIMLLQRAVELRQNDGGIIDSLAWAYYRKGEYHQALDALEQAIELIPDDAVVNDHLGDVYWELGMKREAQFQWRRALEVGAEPDDIKLIKTKLRRVIDER